MGRLLTLLSSEDGGSETIQGVVSSAICDLWGGDTNSYSGTGTNFANLVASPADGTTQSANDWTAADVNTATAMPFSEDHFLPDGTDDAFKITGGNTAFLNKMHQDNAGTGWWIAQYLDLTLSANVVPFSTGGISGTVGLAFLVLSSGAIRLYQRDGTASVKFETLNGTILTGKKLVIVTFDVDTDTVKMFVDGVKTTTTFVLNTAIADASDTAAFGIRADDAQEYLSGDKIYGLSYGNSFLSDSEAADLKTFYESR